MQLKNDKDNARQLLPTSFAFSKDGKTIIIGCSNGWIFLWDMEEEKVIGVLKNHNISGAISPLIHGRLFHVGDLSINATEHFLVSTCAPELVIWDLKSLEKIHQIYHKESDVMGAKFHPLENILVYSSYQNNSVIYFDIEKLSIINELKLEFAPVYLDFSKDGALLLVGGYSDFAICDYSEKEIVRHIKRHQSTGTRHRIERIFFESNMNVFYLSTDCHIYHINAETDELISTFHFLPDVMGADFTGAVGLTEKLAQELKDNGAVINIGEYE